METQRRRGRGETGEPNPSALSASKRFKKKPEQMTDLPAGQAEAQELDTVIRQNLEVLGYGE